ncbi:DUF6480 family protein [Streptomyces sp. NPDC007264]|uniref:DUF6480 family protein n=1 Tax=Streptomyces sp. NPDC007264 TaxID=3364777 RepID=UPI0036D8F7EE
MNHMDQDREPGGTQDVRYRAPEPAPGTSPGPGPARPLGVEPGGVPPGETPPGESCISGAAPKQSYDRTRGWAKAPMTAILVLTVLVAAFFLAFAVMLAV